MTTIELVIDDALLAEVDRATRSLSVSRADFARLAIELALRHQHALALEQQHAQGYARQPSQPDEVEEWEAEQVWGET